MSNLHKVFHKFINCNKDVLILLDDTFCFSKENTESNKKSMSITSISERYDIIECLKEEGSAIINYKISSKGNTRQNNKILNSLISTFIEFNFEPYIMTLINNEVIVSVVISDNDIDFIDDYDDDEFDDENQEDDEDEYDDEIDEDADGDYYGKEEVDEEVTDDEPEEATDEPTVEVIDDEQEHEEEASEEIDEPEVKPDEVSEEVTLNEPEEVPADEVNDEPEPVGDGNELSVKDKIRLEINNDFEKLKKPDILKYMRMLNIYNVDGTYIQLCKKKELCDHLMEILEN